MIRLGRDKQTITLRQKLERLLPKVLVGLTAAFTATALAAATFQVVWKTEIKPVAKKFRALSDVHLILSLTNVTDQDQPIVLPTREDQPWFQWIRIDRNGKLLEPAADEDFGFPMGTVRPGQTLSLLVSLDRFYQKPAGGEEKGTYKLTWPAATLGLAETARAEFEIDPASESPEILNLAYYLKGGNLRDPLTGRRALWKDMLASPSDPKWLGLLRIVPAEWIEPEALLQLAKASLDLGIKREAVRALKRIGPNRDIEPKLVEFLKREKDGVLIEQGVFTLQTLRGASASP